MISIAGHDPSGGAGVLADAKVFERCGVIGFAATSAITCQNEDQFFGVKWLEFCEIQEQLQALTRRHIPQVVKIGLIKDNETLKACVQFIKKLFPRCRIIWDPIIRSSSGFHFHPGFEQSELVEILKIVDVVTPNLDEVKLFGEHGRHCAVIVKGGHAESAAVQDTIYDALGARVIESVRLHKAAKHGSGCVFSSALAAAISYGAELEAACRFAGRITRSYLASSRGKLGFHSPSRLPLSVGLQFISAGQSLDDHILGIRAALEGGIKWVQLRLKGFDHGEWTEAAITTRELCRQHGATFIVNDSPQVAYDAQADGVHLGKKDISPQEARKILGDGAIVGATANCAQDLHRLSWQPVDYIGIGPYAATSTKPDHAEVLGLSGVKQLCCQWQDKRVPLVAVGGIKLEEIDTILDCGPSGVAVSSAIAAAENVRDAASRASQSFISRNLAEVL